MRTPNAKLITCGLSIIAILTLFSGGIQRAVAQDGACCAQLDNEIKKCGGTGCSGQITIRACTEPYGANSIEYHVVVVKCCTVSYSMFTAPTGRVNCSGGVGKVTVPSFRTLPLTEVALLPTMNRSQHAESVWVRVCPQKYAFFDPTVSSPRPGL